MRDSLALSSGPSRSASHGPRPATQHARFAEAETEARAASNDADAGGCVPAPRSVFRLFRRRESAHRRSQSTASHEAASARVGSAGNLSPRTSTSSASDHGGYLRARKTTRAATLSAQRTRSELAVVGPPLQAAVESGVKGVAEPAEGSGRSMMLPGCQLPRLHKADKGTIVQLRLPPDSSRVSIPRLDGIHEDILLDPTPALSCTASGSSPTAEVELCPPFTPRRSTSSDDASCIINQLESRQQQQTEQDDEGLTTTANVAVHVLPDDSSDWNSDFSSPSSWRRSTDRPVSKKVSRIIDGSRLKDRAIDRGVLEAQHRILQQEKHLMQISNLSNALVKLRPLILRCLVFELPDRGIQIGTSTFVSAIREPRGSIEPSIEEERLWELWRQAEALLTVMDNDSVPTSNVESRLTLSKKRAIMLAFCDWEQYSLYVQDGWDKARKGIQQPTSERDSRRSSNQSNGTASNDSSANRDSGSSGNRISKRESIEDDTSSSGGALLSKFSLSTQRKARRRSVVGIAPASLQRIADEAQAIQEECEQLLFLMSPLYRESQLSPRATAALAAGSPHATAFATNVASVVAAAAAAAVDSDETRSAPSATLVSDTTQPSSVPASTAGVML